MAGVNTAVKSVSVTVPATGAVPETRKLPTWIDAGRTCSEKVARTVVSGSTSDSELSGTTEMIVGLVSSGAGALVNARIGRLVYGLSEHRLRWPCASSTVRAWRSACVSTPTTKSTSSASMCSTSW